MGGTQRAFLSERAMEPAWSPDGSRVAFQTSDPGDPVLAADSTGGNSKQIYAAPTAGVHNHFPTWSKDGQWIYFVSGPWDTREMDILRIRPEGGAPPFLRESDLRLSIAGAIRGLSEPVVWSTMRRSRRR